jgi:hypothetical protein
MGSHQKTARDQKSPQARPQVVSTDGGHQDAHDASDQDVGKPSLDPGAAVGSRQAADAQRNAGGPVR